MHKRQKTKKKEEIQFTADEDKID